MPRMDGDRNHLVTAPDRGRRQDVVGTYSLPFDVFPDDRLIANRVDSPQPNTCFIASAIRIKRRTRYRAQKNFRFDIIYERPNSRDVFNFFVA